MPSVRSYYECSLDPPFIESANKRQLQKYLYPPLKGLRTDAAARFRDFLLSPQHADPFSLYAQGFQFCRRLFEIPEADSLDSQFPRRFTVFRRIVDKDAFLRIQAVSVQKDFIDCRLRFQFLYLTGKYDPVHIFQESQPVPGSGSI